jgi:hypothetical protein
MINLQHLVPATPLTKVEASKHPGKLIALFRYILRSFEHMGDKYRREHLRKAVFIGRVALKLASSFHTKVQGIVPAFDIQKNTIQDIIDGLDHGSDGGVNEEAKDASDQLLYDIGYIQKHLKNATTFYDAAESWCKYIKTSAAQGDSTIQTVDKLAAILKDNKKLIVSLQKLANTLAEQAEKAQETILNVELSVEQKVQSLTCMRMPYSYQLDALTEFGHNALLLCTQPQPLVQADEILFCLQTNH